MGRGVVALVSGQEARNLTAVADALDAIRAARSVVVTGHAGKQVEVDVRPTCQHCGKRVGEHFGIPWSVRCANCRKQATSG